MATSSDIKAGLDDVSFTIRDIRNQMKQIRANIGVAKTTLTNIPTTFADLKTTIDGFAANTTNQFEALAKAELAKLTTEYGALRTAIITAESGFTGITEF